MQRLAWFVLPAVLAFGCQSKTESGKPESIKTKSSDKASGDQRPMTVPANVETKAFAAIRALRGTALQVPMTGGVQLNVSFEHSEEWTDAALAHIKSFANFSHVNLDLTGTDVSDAGLRHLAELTNIRTLLLAKRNVTDAGLAHPCSRDPLVAHACSAATAFV